MDRGGPLEKCGDGAVSPEFEDGGSVRLDPEESRFEDLAGEHQPGTFLRFHPANGRLRMDGRVRLPGAMFQNSRSNPSRPKKFPREPNVGPLMVRM